MLPSKFQSAEMGAWVNWNAGAIDPQRLESFGIGYTASYINGVLVYGLQFPNGKEWNVKVGWKQL